MKKEYIDNVIELAKQDLKKEHEYLDEHPPQITGRDKGKISVMFSFNYGAIPGVKIRVDYERRIDIQFTEVITYEVIKNYLSRPSQEIQSSLKKYAQESPLDFQNDVIRCAQTANLENPKYIPSTKPRKNLYDLTKNERWDIANTTIRLYIYLCDLRTQSPENYPQYFEGFLDSYHQLLNMDLEDFENLRNDTDVKEIVSTKEGEGINSIV